MADTSQNAEGNSTGSAGGPKQPDSTNANPPIRTMKDDLAAPANDSSAASPPPSAAPPNQPIDVSAPGKNGATPNGNPAPGPAPAAGHSSQRKWIILVVVLIIFALAGAGGVLFFFFESEDTPPSETTSSLPPASVSALQIVPSRVKSVIHYNLEQTTFRERVARSWENQTSNTPIADLLRGNPSHLLLETDVSELLYVNLTDNPRPYLVVPKSEEIEEIVAQQTEEQVTEVNGWYVLHPLSVAQYISSLDQGSLAQTVQEPLSPDFPLHFITTPTVLADSHKNLDMAYPNLAATNAIVLNGQVSANGAVSLLTNDIVIEGEKSNSDLNQGANSLYENIPADSEFLWEGQNFSEDLTTLADSRGLVIDNEILQKLPVNTILNKLNTPYVYYERQGADGIHDIGMVIHLPEELTTGPEALQLGNKNIEAALQALIPRVTGQSASSDLAFNQTDYAGIGLRFINLVDTTQALDYAFHNDKLLVATSKEGIIALLDTVSGQQDSLEQNSAWSGLLSEAARLPKSRVRIFSNISNPIFAKIFPRGTENVPVISQSSFLETGSTEINAALGWSSIESSTTSSSPAVQPTSSPSPAAVSASESSPTLTPIVSPVILPSN